MSRVRTRRIVRPPMQLTEDRENRSNTSQSQANLLRWLTDTDSRQSRRVPRACVGRRWPPRSGQLVRVLQRGQLQSSQPAILILSHLVELPALLTVRGCANAAVGHRLSTRLQRASANVTFGIDPPSHSHRGLLLFPTTSTGPAKLLLLAVSRLALA